MKKSIAVAVALLGSIGCAQGPPLIQRDPSAQKSAQPEKTKLEQALLSKGRVLIKTFFKAGQIYGTGSATFEGAVLTQVGNEQSTIKGLRIEVQEAGTLERKNTSFLDQDEIDALVKGLDFMEGLSMKYAETSRDYTEVQFQTRGGFAIGFYQSGRDQKGFISSGEFGAVSAFFPITRLQDVKSIVMTTQSSLQSVAAANQ